MTEGNKPVLATPETLAAVLLDGVIVEIMSPELGKSFGFKIRPLALFEERLIDKAVDGMKDSENASQPMSDIDKAQERMRLIIQYGLMEPKLERGIVEKLPSGIFYQLAKAIDDLSAFQTKNLSTSS